jgi:hypothetical protein
LIEAEKLCGGLASQDFEAKKYYPERSTGVEIYLSKPEGLGLDCRRGLNLPLQKSQEESLGMIAFKKLSVWMSLKKNE